MSSGQPSAGSAGPARGSTDPSMKMIGADPAVSALLKAGKRVVALRRNPADQPGGESAGDLDEFIERAQIACSSMLSLKACSDLRSHMPRLLGDGDDLADLYRFLLRSPSPERSRDSERRAVLSRREIEVLKEASHDIGHDEIAKRLGISSRTVGTHLENVYKKLSVRSPMTAVAAAVSMGYMQLSDVGFLQTLLRNGVASPLSELMGPGDYRDDPEMAALVGMMAQTGVLLLLLSAATARAALEHGPCPDGDSGVVCEIDARGAVSRSFRLAANSAGSAVFAPRSALRHGFQPGNLYIEACSITSGHSVLEFTAAGAFVRHHDVLVSLKSERIGCLAFTPDGRLIGTTDGPSSGIYEFGPRSRRPRRIVSGAFDHICTDSEGRINAIERTPVGPALRLFGADGRHCCTWGAMTSSEGYRGIAAGTGGDTYVLRRAGYATMLDKWSPDRRHCISVPVSNADAGAPCSGPRGEICIPHTETREVSVWQPREQRLRRFQLADWIAPLALAADYDGHLWAAGKVI